MKVLIVSDTHGSHRNLEEVLEREAPINMLIHLGDTEGGEDYIEAIADCPVHMIRGNNDFFAYMPAEKEFELKGHHIYITHGHTWYVSMGEEHLNREARRRKADIVMYGHTHRPSVHYSDGLITLNPGSIAYPRQSGRKPSYIIMEIDRNGAPEIEVKYV